MAVCVFAVYTNVFDNHIVEHMSSTLIVTGVIILVILMIKSLFNVSLPLGTFVVSQNLVRSFSVSAQREGYSKY